MGIRRLPRFKAAVNVAGFWLECVVAITVFAVLYTHGYGPATWPAAFVAALAADATRASWSPAPSRSSSDAASPGCCARS